MTRCSRVSPTKLGLGQAEPSDLAPGDFYQGLAIIESSWDLCFHFHSFYLLLEYIRGVIGLLYVRITTSVLLKLVP